MRGVHLSDLNLAARALLCAPQSERVGVINTIIQNATVADKYRKKTGKAHLFYGNGTLGAACQRMRKAPMPDRCDPQYLTCLGLVIEGLLSGR